MEKREYLIRVIGKSVSEFKMLLSESEVETVERFAGMLMSGVESVDSLEIEIISTIDNND